MASVKNRIEAIENGLAKGDAKEEERAARERDSWARAEAESERFIGRIESVLNRLDDDLGARALAEIDGAEWEQIDIRTYGGFGKSNELSLLSNAVLALALARYNGHPAPAIVPRALWDFFSRGDFESFLWRNGGGHFRWLDSCVSCESCALPLPAGNAGGLYGVARLRDEPGHSEALPFKRCPACGGQVAWGAWRQ